MHPVQSIGDHADHCARPWGAIEGMALHGLPWRGAAVILVALSQRHPLRRADCCVRLQTCDK